MYVSELSHFSFWWIIPIGMMLLCCFMMRRRRGRTMCGFGSQHDGNHQTKGANSAIEILDRRYASGEINKEEYQERKSVLTDSKDSLNE